MDKAAENGLRGGRMDTNPVDITSEQAHSSCERYFCWAENPPPREKRRRIFSPLFVHPLSGSRAELPAQASLRKTVYVSAKL
jgi:hypothetical protein